MAGDFEPKGWVSEGQVVTGIFLEVSRFHGLLMVEWEMQ